MYHRDFCINAQKEYPKWVELDEKKRIIFSSGNRKLETKGSKRSGSNVKSTRNSAIRGSALRTAGLRNSMKTPLRTPTFSVTLRHMQHFSHAPLQSSAKSGVTSKLKSARKSAISTTRQGKEIFKVEIPPDPPAKYSIDNFISERSSTFFGSKWSLDAEILKPKAKQQHQLQDSTGNMIDKLKDVFREQFESRLDDHERMMLQRSRQRKASMASIKEKGSKKFPGLEFSGKKMPSSQETARKPG